MKKWFSLSVLFGVFLLLAVDLSAGEKYYVQVRLLRGTWAEEKDILRSEILLTTASTPSLLPLRKPLGMTTENAQQILIDALLESLNLAEVEDLVTISKTVDDDEFGVMEKFGDFKKSRYYRIHIAIKTISPDETKIHLRLLKTHDATFKGQRPSKVEFMEILNESEDEARMENILDREFILKRDDPVVAGIPAKESAYFAHIFLTKSIPPSGPENAKRKPEILKVEMKPLVQKTPAYPAELRKAGYGGSVRLAVFVDESGLVQEAKVVTSLHPYLDNAAVQALRQWKYEPALQDGKPVAVTFQVVVHFDPGAGDFQEKESKKARGEQSYPEPQRTILAEGAKYCLKMKGAVLDFYCRETIKETHYFLGDDKWVLIASRDKSGNTSVQRVLSGDAKKTVRKIFVCDYMLIRKEFIPEERRTILKKDGRPPQNPQKLLNERRYKVLAPLMASIRLLEADRQWQYSYRIVDQDKVRERKTYVIEALPISGNADGVEYGKIWLDQKDFHILKCEIHGVPLEAYEDVLTESADLNIKPVFKATHEYEVENNGILFPTRSEIRVSYDYEVDGQPKKMIKMKTDFDYDQYKFFTVETEPRIIK
jgi:TonB family protein